MRFQKLLLPIVLFFQTIAIAQVGINNTSPKASLDITATNSSTPENTDGILIPRVDAFPSTPPGAAQQGMMVYLTTTSGSNAPGFYYWDNTSTSWIAVIGAKKINDLSDGKSDVNGSSVFLGQGAGLSDDGSDNSNVGVGKYAMRSNTTGYGNTAMGSLSLFNNDDGYNNIALGSSSLYSNTSGHTNIAMGDESLYSNTSGNGNMAIGSRVLYSNTTGDGNMAIGSYALYDNISGRSNIALGGSALADNISGDYNIALGLSALTRNTIGNNNQAIGFQALFSNTEGNYNTVSGYKALLDNTTGSSNTTMGYESLQNNILGNNNVALGKNAGNNSTGSGNVFIGYQAGYAETGDNKLYINNVSANEFNTLLYGEFDNKIVRTNGEFQIGNPNASGYAFPIIDGNANQVMATDGSGQISFVNSSSIFTDTDDQTIDQFDLTGTTLNLSLESDGVATQTVDLSSLQDADWFAEGTTAAPNSINDDIFTQGNVAIGKTTASYPLDIETSIATRGANTLVTGNTEGFIYGQFIENSNSGSGEHYGSFIHLSSTGSGRQYGNYQNIINTGSGEHYGSYNRLAGSGTGNQYGSYQNITNTGSGEHYCTYNSIGNSGGGTGNKYGSYNFIYDLALGTHYGVYSKVLKTNSYAAYFLGKVSIGTTTTNNYILPSTRGTTNQIMQTNGTGGTSWVNSDTIGTDDQNITGSGLSGTNLTIGIENGSSQVIDLSSLQGASKIDELTDGKSDATGSTIFLGNNAGAVDDGTANNNIGIGLNSLLSNTTGGNSIAIGVNALDSNINANYNIAIGTNALSSTTNNGQNLALGYFSMASTVNGNSNVALGHNALTANISGDNNVIIGHEAGLQNNGSGNVFIGKSAGNQELTANNKLYIDNSGTASPLIYGDFSSNEIGINWNSAVALPNTLSVNGDASKSTSGSWLANSDRRLKKEILSISGKEALNKINKMRGVTYLWNDDKTGIKRPTDIQYGFIAQELKEVFPSKVSKDKLGYYQTAYGDYDPIFAEAIKELNKQVKTLSKKNQNQEKEIARLKKELSKFESLEAKINSLQEKVNGLNVNPVFSAKN